MSTTRSGSRSRPLPVTALVVLLAIVAAACASGDSGRSADSDAEARDRTAVVDDPAGTGGEEAEPDEPGPRPGGIGTDGVTDWPVTDPAALGLDADVLDEMAADAEAEGSTCLLVARGGHIAAEHHWGDEDAHEPREVFSVTKSFTAILTGIAADDGSLALDDPVADWIPEWRGTPSEPVTVDHLLRNDSGREWSVAIDYTEMAVAHDRTGYAVELGQDAPPGDVWAYNNSAIQTLDRVLEEATGEPTHRFAAERLLEPLGMDDSEFTTDPAGNTLTFMGLRSTCRDLARFGVLLQNGGEWNGEQIVSADYIADSIRPAQDLTSAYGRLIWLNRKGAVASALHPLDRAAVTEEPETQLVPDRPETLHWALGLGGQVIQMDPDGDTVVVRLGPASVSDPTGAGGEGYGPHLSAKVLDAIVDDPSTEPDDADDPIRADRD